VGEKVTNGGRYGGADVIFTRMGVSLDTHLDMGKMFDTSYTRKQIEETTKLGASSIREKLRDMERWGFIKQTGRDIYTITDLGKAIIEGGEKRISAIETALNNSPLWKHLINNIGKTPDRTKFDNAVKSESGLANISKDALDNLWSGYNADINCITKSPPFATRKQPPRYAGSSRDTLRQKIEHTEPKNPIPAGGVQPVASKGLLTVVDLPLNEKLTIEYGSLKFEVNDKSTAAIAKLLIRAKEQGVKRGEDYEQK
jgi:hypothetical protein